MWERARDVCSYCDRTETLREIFHIVHITLSQTSLPPNIYANKNKMQKKRGRLVKRGLQKKVKSILTKLPSAPRRSVAPPSLWGPHVGSVKGANTRHTRFAWGVAVIVIRALVLLLNIIPLISALGPLSRCLTSSNNMHYLVVLAASVIVGLAASPPLHMDNGRATRPPMGWRYVTVSFC